MKKARSKGSDYKPAPRRNTSDWLRVVDAYYLKGTYMGASRECGISESQIRSHRKRHPEFWEKHIDRLTEQTRTKHLARFRELIDKATSEAIDRLDNGNEQLDHKTGEMRRVKVSAREAATIAGIFTDKARVAQGQPTSIRATTGSGDALERLKKAALEQADESGKPKPPESADDDDAVSVH